jgi:glycosyltransferase involved in cell wall biosynthesis
MSPKVSVVMPVLNGQRYIGEAIQSIAAQTYKTVELVVVDDGSTDATYDRVMAFAKSIELKYLRHPAPRGIPQSMNDGVRHASGDLIAFLDHDDMWFPEFLETQVDYLLRNPEVGMVHSDFQTVDVNGKIIEESVAICRGRRRPSGYVFPQLFMDSFIVGNSVLIRKECFRRLGLFDEGLRWGDYHMWMRIARHYKVDYVGKVLTKYRQHPMQSTRSAAAGRADEESVGLMAVKKILKEYPEARTELGARRIRRRISFLYFDMAYSWFSKQAFRNARVCLARAIRVWPADPRYFMLYAGTLLSPAHSAALRKAWRRLRGTAEAFQ